MSSNLGSGNIITHLIAGTNFGFIAIETNSMPVKRAQQC